MLVSHIRVNIVVDSVQKHTRFLVSCWCREAAFLHFATNYVCTSTPRKLIIFHVEYPFFNAKETLQHEKTPTPTVSLCAYF